jgi:Ca-activated chloride channel family protein
MERPPARARLAQVRVGASTSDGERHTAGDQGLVVSFSLDESLVVQTDPQVLGYVQQKSLDTLLRQAAVAPDPRPALSSALAVSKRLNNPNVTRIVAGALDEASRLGSLAPQTRKSILLRPRNQTVKIGATGVASDVGPVPSDEEIRRITGREVLGRSKYLLAAWWLSEAEAFRENCRPAAVAPGLQRRL